MKYKFEITLQTVDGRMVDCPLVDPSTQKSLILAGESFSQVLRQLIEPLSDFESHLQFGLTIRGISSKVEL